MDTGLYRKLTEEEINRLKDNDNTAIPDDWSHITVTCDFSERHCEYINGCSFKSSCQIGIFERNSRASVDYPLGLKNTNFTRCIIHNNAHIIDTTLIKNIEIGDNVTIAGCGSLVYNGGNCGEGSKAVIGNEIGKRELILTSSLNLQSATNWILENAPLSSESPVRRSKIQNDSTIISCETLENIYLGSSSFIKNSVIKNSTLLSTDIYPIIIENNVIIENSIIHSHNSIKNQAIIENCIIFEGCHISNQAKISDSLIGSFGAMSCGEIHNSFLGPLMAAHHQSLVQSVIAPFGRSNIAYGSNVGSNHTGRAPDQEMWLGEGVFIGLGVNVKYPLSLIHSHYSIIASSVTLLPQTISFPFSLINVPSKNIHDISPAYNEIFPAWVLLFSQYSLLRNIRKFKQRSEGNNPKVLSKRVVQTMVNAYQSLNKVTRKEIYTDRDLPCLGKNYMTEESRANGMEGYRNFIAFYVVESLFESYMELKNNPDQSLDNLDDLGKPIGFDIVEDLMGFSVEQLPSVYIHYRECLLESSLRSKDKDNIRGKQIIPNYDHFYDESAYDSVIQAESKEIARLKQSLNLSVSNNINGEANQQVIIA